MIGIAAASSVLGVIIGTYSAFRLYDVKFCKKNIIGLFKLMRGEQWTSVVSYLDIKDSWYSRLIYFPNILDYYLNTIKR